jgi:outer membrane cobalamin receptor
METMTLHDSEWSLVVTAMRSAATRYTEVAAVMETTKYADIFRQQAADTLALANRIAGSVGV